MSEQRCEPPEHLRERVARAINEGLGESWAYSNYSGREWTACRDMLDSAADAVLAILITPAEADALRAERDALLAERTMHDTPAWQANERLNEVVHQQADELATLRAEVGRLREALEPFAAMAEHYPPTRLYGGRPYSGVLYAVSSGGKPDAEITVEHLREARSAIAAAKGETT